MIPLRAAPLEICSIEGCLKPPYARGRCRAHYRYLLEQGDRCDRSDRGKERDPDTVDLVAVAPDRHTHQPLITATVCRRGELVRMPFDHDGTPGGIADAFVEVAEWIRKGAP